MFRLSDRGPAEQPAERDEVTDFVSALVRDGRVSASACPLTLDDAALLGLRRQGADFLLPSDWEPLVPAAVRSALSNRARNWLTALEVHPVIGSTNTELVERGRIGAIAGQVLLAELQLRGRGRRGRVWLSPLGGNLAVSMGFRAAGPASELGGLSLVAGLAVIDALEAVGVLGLSLKWPNDILLEGAKLGGILIELVPGPAQTSLVIGIGINLKLGAPARANLNVPVAELQEAFEVLPSRSELAGRLVSSVVEFEAAFSSAGFEPFMEAFDCRHAYHRSEVCILQGEHQHFGQIEGVAVDGGLRVVTADGRRIFHGGEVSLRRQSP